MLTLVASEGLAQLCVPSSRSAVFGFWFISPGKCLVPKCLLPGAAQLEREIVRQILPRAALGCKGSRCVTTFSSATKSFDDLRPSVLHAASVFFFFAFFALFLGFCGRVGRIAAGAAGTRLDCHLTVLWQSPRVRGAALEQQMHCQSLSLGGARRAIYFFGDVFGGVLPGVVLLGDRWRDSSRPAALAQSRRRSATPLESS